MHVATYTNGTTYFNHGDWLGTERMRTGVNGNITEVCRNQAFGDSQQCEGEETTHHHFTGKERDDETGFDYFGARYYSSSLGHWMTPDWDAKAVTVPYAHFGNPQSLNLYAYVGNNPLSIVDPDGHNPVMPISNPFRGDMLLTSIIRLPQGHLRVR